LRVTSRQSAYAFQGKNVEPEEIARKLNVTKLLEGSVRNQGNRVRITVSMIQAAGGFEEWSGSFDGQLDDSLDLPKDIATKVTDALRLKMFGEERGSAGNPQVVAACMKGWYSHHRQQWKQAIEYFESAIKLDPNFAEAWVGLGQSVGSQADSGEVQNTADAYRKERQAIEKALLIDPHLPSAYDALGWVSMLRDFNFEDARSSFQRALKEQPEYPYSIAHLANVDSIEGHSDEAIAGYRRALDRDPVNPAAYIDFGKILFYAGRREEAIRAYQEALKIDPQTKRVHYRLGCVYLTQSKTLEAVAEMEQEKHPIWGPFGRALAYHAAGRKKESDAILADLIAKYAKGGPFNIAEVYAFRGEKDLAFEWLNHAYDDRDGGLVEVKGDPLLKSLEGDPRYAALLNKMHLPL
jgi:tetratricopeptide (TPR) repeat protein